MVTSRRSEKLIYTTFLLAISLAMVACDSSSSPGSSSSNTSAAGASGSGSSGSSGSSGYVGSTGSSGSSSGAITQLQDGIYIASNGAVLSMTSNIGTFYPSLCQGGIQFSAAAPVNQTTFLFGASSIQVNTCQGSGAEPVDFTQNDPAGISYSVADCEAVYNFIGIVNSDGSIGLDYNSTLNNTYQSLEMTYSSQSYSEYLEANPPICPATP